MKYILEIDDSSSAGKHLIGLVKSLFKKDKGIALLAESEIERREDLLLSKMIEESMKSGLADKNAVLTLLNIK